MRHTSRKTNVNAKQCSLLLQHQKHQHCRRLRGVSSTGTRALKQHALAVALSIVCAIFSSLSTAANTALDQTRTYQLNLPEQTVAAALTSLSEQTDIQVLFPYDIATQHQSTALVGNYPLQQALSILLLNTGLHAGLTDSGVITISRTGSNVDINQNGKGKNMNTNKRKTVLATMVGLFAAGGMSATMAQGQMGESARAQGVLDEIIVTAQKREQSLQDVPIAITAFVGERLGKSGIDDSQSLVMVVPGLSFSTLTGMGLVSIRGIGSPLLQGPGLDPTAAVYIDGVYQSRFTSAAFDFMDVERLEVLKGPQGTLYGRNATSGAIKIVSNTPSKEFGGGVSVTTGNYNLKKMKLTLDTPLIEDKLLMRTSLVRTKRDGYTKDILNGFDADFEDLKAGRLTLKYIPSDNVDVTFHGSVLHDNGDAAATKHFIDPDGAFFGAGIAEVISDPRTIKTDFGPRKVETRIHSFDLTVNVDLDWADLTSITGYTYNEEGPWQFDLDATEIAGFNQGSAVGSADGLYFETKTLTKEVMLSSNDDDAFQWTVGMFLLDDNPLWDTGIGVPLFGIPLNEFRVNIETEAYALFSHFTYSISDRLKANFGLRYSYEKKERTATNINGGAVVRGPEVDSESWNALTQKIGIDFFPNQNAMIYLSASRGFKSGGYDGGASAFEPPVEPEYINAYEVGVKTKWLDGGLTANMSVFHYDYTDLQVLSLAPQDGPLVATVLSNAAEATIKGADVEVSAIVFDTISIDLGMAYLDAKFDRYMTELNGAPFDASGNHLPAAPEFTTNLGLEYRHPSEVFSGNFSIRADYFYSEEKFFDQYQRSGARQKPYDLLNARMTYLSNDGAWELSAYGKNLTDELVVSSALLFGLIGDGAISNLTPPKTYGLSVSYNF